MGQCGSKPAVIDSTAPDDNTPNNKPSSQRISKIPEYSPKNPIIPHLVAAKEAAPKDATGGHEILKNSKTNVTLFSKGDSKDDRKGSVKISHDEKPECARSGRGKIQDHKSNAVAKTPTSSRTSSSNQSCEIKAAKANNNSQTARRDAGTRKEETSKNRTKMSKSTRDESNDGREKVSGCTRRSCEACRHKTEIMRHECGTTPLCNGKTDAGGQEVKTSVTSASSRRSSAEQVKPRSQRKTEVKNSDIKPKSSTTSQNISSSKPKPRISSQNYKENNKVHGLDSCSETSASSGQSSSPQPKKIFEHIAVIDASDKYSVTDTRSTMNEIQNSSKSKVRVNTAQTEKNKDDVADDLCSVMSSSSRQSYLSKPKTRSQRMASVDTCDNQSVTSVKSTKSYTARPSLSKVRVIVPKQSENNHSEVGDDSCSVVSASSRQSHLAKPKTRSKRKTDIDMSDTLSVASMNSTRSYPARSSVSKVRISVPKPSRENKHADVGDDSCSVISTGSRQSHLAMPKTRSRRKNDVDTSDTASVTSVNSARSYPARSSVSKVRINVPKPSRENKHADVGDDSCSVISTGSRQSHLAQPKRRSQRKADTDASDTLSVKSINSARSYPVRSSVSKVQLNAPKKNEGNSLSDIGDDSCSVISTSFRQSYLAEPPKTRSQRKADADCSAKASSTTEKESVHSNSSRSKVHPKMKVSSINDENYDCANVGDDSCSVMSSSSRKSHLSQPKVRVQKLQADTNISATSSGKNSSNRVHSKRYLEKQQHEHPGVSKSMSYDTSLVSVA